MNVSTRTAIIETVLQSAIIHPDWTVDDHVSYIINDAFVVSERSGTLTRLVEATLAEATRTAPETLRCDHCGQPVRVARGLASGAYQHADAAPPEAEWCETDGGYIRVTVGGERHDPNAVGRI